MGVWSLIAIVIALLLLVATILFKEDAVDRYAPPPGTTRLCDTCNPCGGDAPEPCGGCGSAFAPLDNYLADRPQQDTAMSRYIERSA